MSANGPIPADGFLNTAGAADDNDYFILRLQPRRQITMTIRRVSGCTSVGGYGNNMDLVERDGKQLFTFSNFNSTTAAVVETWTTPRDAAEYVGRIGIDSFRGVGCQTLVTVTPADAVITGPLPMSGAGRVLQASAPAAVPRNAAVAVVATGVAADDERVAAQWRTGGCPAAPDRDTNELVQGDLLAAGPFSVTLQTTSPDARGTATLCTWLVDTLGKLTPLVRQQSVAVDPPPPSGVVGARAVVAGRGLGARIANATGSVEFRFGRNGRVLARRTGTIAGGRVTISTVGIRPGRYVVSLWHNARRIGSRSVQIKPVPTTTRLLAPRSVRVGTTAVLAGRVRAGIAVPKGRCVLRARSASGRGASTVRASARLSPRGTCTLRVRLTQTSSVRLAFAGATGWKSSSSTPRLIRVRR